MTVSFLQDKDKDKLKTSQFKNVTPVNELSNEFWNLKLSCNLLDIGSQMIKTITRVFQDY